ncbi:MAG: carbohydrate kinase family protein [bacterium]|nr:carbohydrate kinase family protein [bacterium]
MNKPAFDCISIGDTQHDVFLEVEERAKLFKDGENTYLGLAFPEKFPVKKYTTVTAVGNAANAAVGASRLGLKTAFYTVLSDDHIGKEEYEVFEKEKISTKFIQWDKKRRSNFSAVLNYKGDRTILVHHEQRDYDLPDLPAASWVYFSSVASEHATLHSQIASYIKASGAKLAFNPGSHQLHDGLQGLKDILEVAHVFFVNKKEAQELTQNNTTDEKTLLQLLSKEGPSIVVMTDGVRGSFSFDGTNFYKLDIVHVPLVEMTGAGDAYAVACMASLAHGQPISEGMRWGAMNSASVIQYIGAREGLLTKENMEKSLKEHAEPQAATF